MLTSLRYFVLSAVILLLLPINSFSAITIKNISRPSYSKNITDMKSDGNNLWIGTSSSGVIKVNKATLDFNISKVTEYRKMYGLISDKVNKIEVAFGKTFVATDLGISVIDANDNISNHTILEGVVLSNSLVLSDGKSVIIIGSNSAGGIVLYDGMKYKKIQFFQDEAPKINAALMSSKNFYIITNEAAIHKIPLKVINIFSQWRSFNPPSTLIPFKPPYEISNLVIDERNVLWFVTKGNLYHFDGKKYKKISLSSLGRAEITGLLVSDGGFKYISTSSGLIAYVNGRSRKLTKSDGLSDNSISSICTDGDALLISTLIGVDSLGISSLEHDRIDCLSCHTAGANGGVYTHVDGQFLTIGAIRENASIKSSHKIHYNPDLDLSKSANNECLKCHGKMHPNDESIVINIDNGESYAKGSNNRDFCISCHDYKYIVDEEIAPATHQLWNLLPQNVMTYYNMTGHGANLSLSAGETIISNNDCSACHDHHGSKNASLITDTASYPLTEDSIFNATNRDAFCKDRCHKTVTNGALRPVRDHTYALNSDEARDHGGCPNEPCDTHPSNAPIPDNIHFKYPSVDLPLSGYDSVEELNSGYIVCTTCHDPHGSPPPADNPFTTDAQMVRKEWIAFNTLCNECHL